jgi:hypothetical protein
VSGNDSNVFTGSIYNLIHQEKKILDFFVERYLVHPLLIQEIIGFTAVQCRSALRHWCLNPKEMKVFSTQGSGID